jgi:ABC-2 type transport system permease protein
MRNILAVAGKELRNYFHTPIAYVVMADYTALCGFVFYSSTAFFALQSFRMEAQGGMGMPPISLNEYVIQPILGGVLTVVLLFLIPVVTMKLYAEEKRSGTIELLLTSPLTDMEIILGKFFGAMFLFAILEALTFVYFAILFIYGNPNAKPLLANALGMLLYGGALLALGMWISTFTKDQVTAGTVGMHAFLLLYLLGWVSAYSQSTVGQVASYLCLTTHFDNFAKGVIQLSDVVYYLSVMILGVFLTARSVEALKGRP